MLQTHKGSSETSVEYQSSTHKDALQTHKGSSETDDGVTFVDVVAPLQTHKGSSETDVVALTDERFDASNPQGFV